MNENEEAVAVSVPKQGKLGALQRRYAKRRFQLINLKHRLEHYWFGKQRKVELFVWGGLGALLAVAARWSDTVLQPFLENEQFVDSLRTTALQLGSSLMGATAIVASLVLFAMQVNVERLPHGLFRRMSGDRRLLVTFAVSFVGSIVIACLPLITPLRWTEWAIAAAILLTIIVLRLFLAAYRRSLKLINPAEQLRIVMGDINGALKRWSKQADWYSAAFGSKTETTKSSSIVESTLDTSRAAFMLQNNWGSRVVRQGLNHCISVGSRAASQADYRVAEAALAAFVTMNASYVQAKGRTFFAENGFVEVPFATDSIINHSLEQLKLQFRAAVGRRDEEHVNLLLNAYGDLAQLYARIDYGRPDADAWHSTLATGYLRNDIRSIIPQNLPDSMMHGVRILGTCSLALINRDKATEIISIVDELGPIGAAMSVREDHRPVTITVVEQLAGLTFQMINTGVFDPGYTFEQISHAIELTARVTLNQPNPSLTSVHRSNLAPYFSPTSASSLSQSLKQMTNALLSSSADDEKATKCAANLLEWAERSRSMSKSIMTLAIEQRSPFVFDILHWIGDVVEVLIAVAKAPIAEQHYAQDFDEQAQRWLSTLSWIPDDAESIDCASTWSITSVLFEIAGAARQHGSESLYDAVQKQLLHWALRPARRQTAWHEVEQAILASVALAIKSANDPDGQVFKLRLTKALEAKDMPAADLLDGAAKGIIRSIDDYQKDFLLTNGWEQVLKSCDHEQRRQLLTEVANIVDVAAKSR